MGEPASKGSEQRRLQRWEHTQFDGIPYYDEALKVAQSDAHRICVYEVGSILETVADDAGLRFLSDHPIWYWHPETDEQKCFFNDLVLLRDTDVQRVTADDVLCALEIVTTSERKKEIKDTAFQRAVAEYNGVAEFGLIFPELDDPRSLTWLVLDAASGTYREIALSSGGSVDSRTVAGLSLRVLPRDQWQPGRKVEVLYRGEPRRGLRAERLRAEQDRERADQERQRADRLAQQLRDLGVEPDSD